MNIRQRQALTAVADFLPAVRLTPRGLWDVKRTRVLLPARRRGR